MRPAEGFWSNSEFR